jgi:hypothetical protein
MGALAWFGFVEQELELSGGYRCVGRRCLT